MSSSGKKNGALNKEHEEKEIAVGQCESATQGPRPVFAKSHEEENSSTKRQEGGAMKKCVSESFSKPGSSKETQQGTESDPTPALHTVKPLLSEASKSYRNSLLINQKLQARNVACTTGSHTRIHSRTVSGRQRRDSPWPSQENLNHLKKNHSGPLLTDLRTTEGTDSPDEDLDQVEQRPVVVVHSEPMVATYSILKKCRPASEQGGGAAPPQEKRVKWSEEVDVIHYSGDSEVDRTIERLREEWGGRSPMPVCKRVSVDRRPFLDPGSFC